MINFSQLWAGVWLTGSCQSGENCFAFWEQTELHSGQLIIVHWTSMCCRIRHMCWGLHCCSSLCSTSSQWGNRKSAAGGEGGGGEGGGRGKEGKKKSLNATCDGRPIASYWWWKYFYHPYIYGLLWELLCYSELVRVLDHPLHSWKIYISWELYPHELLLSPGLDSLTIRQIRF